MSSTPRMQTARIIVLRAVLFAWAAERLGYLTRLRRHPPCSLDAGVLFALKCRRNGYSSSEEPQAMFADRPAHKFGSRGFPRSCCHLQALSPPPGVHTQFRTSRAISGPHNAL
jgi:hypothetical protein